MSRVKSGTTKLRDEAALERFQAVEAEREKWEAREERLVKQLEELQSQLAEKKSVENPATASLRVRITTERDPVASTCKGNPALEPASQTSGTTVDKDGDVSATKDTEGAKRTGGNPNLNPSSPSSLTAALVAQQLPPLPKYSG